MRDIRTIGEQSGRTTGRLRSTGLHAISGMAQLVLRSFNHRTQPGLGTTSDDFGPAETTTGRQRRLRAGTLELIYRCFHHRASTLSVTTMSRVEQPEDGPVAAAAAGARRTRMSLLWVGRSSWRTWAGATSH